MSRYIDFADYYDFDHAFDFDLSFYHGYARRCGSPILELACGTGRVTISLALAGCDVHGLDISENMLAVCRQAVAHQDLAGRVHLHLADMAAFELPRKEFALIFVALRSFMHLLTRAEQLACLQNAYNHLRPGGLLIVDVIAPDPYKLARLPDGAFTVQREFDLPNGHHVVRKDRLLGHDRANQVRNFEFLFEEFDGENALVRRQLVPLSTRYLTLAEMRCLLQTADLQIVDIFRDYDRNPYDGTGEMIIVARRPSGDSVTPA